MGVKHYNEKQRCHSLIVWPVKILIYQLIEEAKIHGDLRDTYMALIMLYNTVTVCFHVGCDELSVGRVCRNTTARECDGARCHADEPSGISGINQRW